MKIDQTAMERHLKTRLGYDVFMDDVDVISAETGGRIGHVRTTRGQAQLTFVSADIGGEELVPMLCGFAEAHEIN